jgi:small subunit ribosomal protein S15
MISTAKKTTSAKTVKTAAKPVKKVLDTEVSVGSPEAQVTTMTARISELTEHLKTNKKDHMARRGLLQLVGKRRRLLTYLARKDGKAYLATIKKLGLRR